MDENAMLNEEQKVEIYPTKVEFANHVMTTHTVDGYFLEFRAIAPTVFTNKTAQGSIGVDIRDFHPQYKVLIPEYAMEDFLRRLENLRETVLKNEPKQPE